MNRRDYVERVLSCLRRATPSELAAVRAELDGHIEDHMADLLDLGYSEELAEERTMAAMGDPEEMGRALDQQYSPFWLWVGRAAAAALTILAVMALMGSFGLHWIFCSFQARLAPWSDVYENWAEEINLELDVRQPIGSDILRILGSGTKKDGDQPTAVILMCQYDQNPFGRVTEKELTYFDCRGSNTISGGSGHSTVGAAYSLRELEVREGDPYVSIVCERYGERIEIEVPLEWEGTDE